MSDGFEILTLPCKPYIKDWLENNFGPPPLDLSPDSQLITRLKHSLSGIKTIQPSLNNKCCISVEIKIPADWCFKIGRYLNKKECIDFQNYIEGRVKAQMFNYVGLCVSEGKNLARSILQYQTDFNMFNWDAQTIKKIIDRNCYRTETEKSMFSKQAQKLLEHYKNSELYLNKKPTSHYKRNAMKNYAVTTSHFLFLRTEKQYQVPTQWEDLSGDQLIKLARYGYLNRELILEDPFLLGIDPVKAARIPEEDLNQIFNDLKFLEYPQPVKNFKILTLGALIAPNLDKISFGTFMNGDYYWYNYVYSGQRSFLSKFIACFYRLPGNRRDELSTDEIDEIAIQIDKLFNIIEQGAIALNYALIRKWLEQEYNFFKIFNYNTTYSEPIKRPGEIRVFNVTPFDSTYPKNAGHPNNILSLTIEALAKALNRSPEYYSHHSAEFILNVIDTLAISWSLKDPLQNNFNNFLSILSRGFAQNKLNQRYSN